MLRSRKPRLVVRRSLSHIALQIIAYHPDGDKILASAHSSELKKFGWKTATNNLPAAYLAGLMLGRRAKGKFPEGCVLDMGLRPSTKGSRIYAALKGAIEAGLVIPHGEDILPGDDRVMGCDIAKYAKILKKDNPDRYKAQFSQYIKNKVDPADMKSYVEGVKKKILNE